MKKSKLREKVLRRLGWPVIKIELTEDHLNDAIDESKSKFVDFATGKATEESYYILPISAGIDRYELPETVHSVVKSEIPESMKTGLNFFDDTCVSYYALPMDLVECTDMYSTLNNFDLVSSVFMNSYIKLLDNFSISKYIIDYHDLQNQIWIYPSPSENFYLLLKVFSVVPEEILFDQSWVCKYAAAISKKFLGEIRSKYSGISLPGGGSLNGERLISEANEEMLSLVEALDSESFMGLPIDFD